MDAFSSLGNLGDASGLLLVALAPEPRRELGGRKGSLVQHHPDLLLVIFVLAPNNTMIEAEIFPVCPGHVVCGVGGRKERDVCKILTAVSNSQFPWHPPTFLTVFAG